MTVLAEVRSVSFKAEDVLRGVALRYPAVAERSSVIAQREGKE
jgi:hypothetical protein